MPDGVNVFGQGVLRRLKSVIEYNSLGELLIRAGKISPLEMKELLKKQKDSGLKIGQIAIKHGFIGPKELFFLLFKQRSIRILATFLTLSASIMCFKSQKARAGSIQDVPALLKVSYTPDYNRFEYVHKHPQIFGTNEIRSKDISAFKKWSDMFDRFEASLREENSDPVLQHFKSQLKQMSDLKPAHMIGQVNKLVNQIKYIEDRANWNKSDYWATPVEFLERGGDCEDYAITKYVALRALGFPENRLRIAVVQDLIKDIPHAVLIVYSDEGPLILDNQTRLVKKVENVFRYKPHFSINRHAWWLHRKIQSEPTLVAAVN